MENVFWKEIAQSIEKESYPHPSEWTYHEIIVFLNRMEHKVIAYCKRDSKKAILCKVPHVNGEFRYEQLSVISSRTFRRIFNYKSSGNLFTKNLFAIYLGYDSFEHFINKNNLVTDTVQLTKENYQIGLSFAGEDRVYVRKVAHKLKQEGVNVFYDEFEQVDLWGKDLYQHLNEVYKIKCDFCIIFISQHYAKKVWTRHELKSAQTRAFESNKEYILPVRFDSTELPGINKTISYLDANKYLPEEIALMAIRKIYK